VVDCPIDRNTFENCVARMLVQQLRPGSIVATNKLSGRKGPRVRQVIEASGARPRQLRPNSPNFNLIENAFAKLKASLRNAASRSVTGLRAACGRIADLVRPAECANCFSAPGYDAT